MQEIKTEKIVIGYNPRNQFDLEKLKENIKTKGILISLIVRPKGDKFEIICGESRFKCANELNLKTVPCFVKKYSDIDAAHLTFIDNEQRNNLATVDKADHMVHMKDKFKLSASDLAKEYAIGKSEVGRNWKISEFNKDIKAFLRRNDIGIFKAYEITKMLDKDALIKVYEDSSRKPKEEWDPATKKAYEKELFYREECQMQLIRRIISSYLTLDQVKSAVTSYLNEFKRRDEEIKMETAEKVVKFWEQFKSTINNFTLSLRTINTNTPAIEIFRQSIPDEIINKTGQEDKNKVADYISELIEEMSDDKLQRMKSARIQLFNLAEELRR